LGEFQSVGEYELVSVHEDSEGQEVPKGRRTGKIGAIIDIPEKVRESVKAWAEGFS
jgi:hypothetical protein